MRIDTEIQYRGMHVCACVCLRVPVCACVCIVRHTCAPTHACCMCPMNPSSILACIHPCSQPHRQPAMQQLKPAALVVRIRSRTMIGRTHACIKVFACVRILSPAFALCMYASRAPSTRRTTWLPALAIELRNASGLRSRERELAHFRACACAHVRGDSLPHARMHVYAVHPRAPAHARRAHAHALAKARKHARHATARPRHAIQGEPLVYHYLSKIGFLTSGK